MDLGGCTRGGEVDARESTRSCFENCCYRDADGLMNLGVLFPTFLAAVGDSEYQEQEVLE